MNSWIFLFSRRTTHRASFCSGSSKSRLKRKASATTLVERVKMVKDNPGAMFILDQELSKRKLGAEDGGDE